MMLYYVILLFIIVKGRDVIGVTHCRGKACIQCTCLDPQVTAQDILIQCNNSQIILSLGWKRRPIRYDYHYNEQACSGSNIYSGQRQVTCFDTKRNNRSGSHHLGYQVVLDMYKLCVGLNSCNISFITRRYPMTIEIPFVCKSESTMIDMYKQVSHCRVPHLDLYLYGDKHLGENLNCGCTVSVSNTSLPVYLYVYFINLGVNTCNNVSITTNGQNVLNCSKSGLQSFSQSMGTIDGEFKIQLTDLIVDEGDMVYLTLGGTGECVMDVICSGCDESVSTELYATIPNEVTTEYDITFKSSQPEELTTDEYVNIDITTTDIPFKGDNTSPPSLESTSPIGRSNTTDGIRPIEVTTEKSSTTDHITPIEVTTEKSNTTEDAEDDYTDKSIDNYIIYGILTVVLVIIVVVVLSVFCYSRHKSKEAREEDVVYFTRTDSQLKEGSLLTCTNYNYTGDVEEISQS